MSRAICLTLILLLFAGLALAGDWRVVPIRLDLGKAKRSDVVRLINQGSEKINLQVKAAEWTQDAEGQDLYQESAELIFFPKILSIAPKEERVLRAGIQMPALQTEKAYRLFIEEIPEPREGEGSTVSINIRFGLPVFVAPLQEAVKGEIAALQLKSGLFTAAVQNTGNASFRIHTLTLKGKSREGTEVFRHQAQGWYLLAGAARTYSFPLAEEECRKAGVVELEVDTDKLDLKRTLEVDPTWCRP